MIRARVYVVHDMMWLAKLFKLDTLALTWSVRIRELTSLSSCTMPFTRLCPQCFASVANQPPKQAHTATTDDIITAFDTHKPGTMEYPVMGIACSVLLPYHLDSIGI